MAEQRAQGPLHCGGPVGDTSIRRLEDMGEGQASQFAMAKAIASGDERLMRKAGLEAEIARLERLRAAHDDDQFAIRRQIRDAERDIEHATRRIAEIGKGLERLIATAGDAFAMTVTGKRYTERKLAGRALMKEILKLVQLQEENENAIASIGGFDLVFSGERFGRDGYRYEKALRRTGGDHEAGLDMTITPLGAISRLEHALSNFEGERDGHRSRLGEAERRLSSYRSRIGEVFAYAAELQRNWEQLVEIEASLATDVDGSADRKALAA